MEFTLKQIAALLGGIVQGDEDDKVNNLAKIEEATKGTIAFLSNPKYEEYIYITQASAVIVSKTFVPKAPYSTSLIVVDDPYTAFSILLGQYQALLLAAKIGVEEPAYLGSNASIGNGIYRGAFSYIGNNCKIGNNVKLYPHVHIGDNATIGDNCILYAGVKIYDGTQIGHSCVIHAGAVVGSDGFGFAPQPDGTYKTIPQIGIVRLGNHVSIGANTTIDRATMGETIIADGVKIDNLVQIAHNVEIGKNTAMAALVGVSGSTKIGEGCAIAGQVGVGGHLTIANHSTIGPQTGVNRSIEKAGLKWLGTPAIDYISSMKSMLIQTKLPELLRRIEKLEKNATSA